MKIDVTASMQEFTDTINPLSANPTKWSNTPPIRRHFICMYPFSSLLQQLGLSEI